MRKKNGNSVGHYTIIAGFSSMPRDLSGEGGPTKQKKEGTTKFPIAGESPPPLMKVSYLRNEVTEQQPPGYFFLAGAFLAAAFLAGAFLAGAFLAGAFLAVAFLLGLLAVLAAFLGAAFTVFFFAGAFAFLVAAMVFPPFLYIVFERKL
jgi:hypothetical protein